jgi:AraC-like DNA-binding protein
MSRISPNAKRGSGHDVSRERHHRNRPQPLGLQAAGPGSGPSLPLSERLRMRDRFFRTVAIDPREFLHAFEFVPGLSYFVKDAESRTMLSSREYTRRIGAQSGQESIGLRPHECVAKELADHYQMDDQKVLQSGQPLRNIIEIGFDERGVPDWISTDKFPLRDARGRVIGIIGTIQSLKGRLHRLPHLGEVGRAADYIRQNLGERIHLDDVAASVGLSKRHLQRLFRKFIRMTIQQFIIHSRVHAAANELTQSERPMAEIALMFGFSDQSAFSNTFHRIIGMPPREYRDRFLNDLTRS